MGVETHRNRFSFTFCMQPAGYAFPVFCAFATVRRCRSHYVFVIGPSVRPSVHGFVSAMSALWIDGFSPDFCR